MPPKPMTIAHDYAIPCHAMPWKIPGYGTWDEIQGLVEGSIFLPILKNAIRLAGAAKVLSPPQLILPPPPLTLGPIDTWQHVDFTSRFSSVYAILLKL